MLHNSETALEAAAKNTLPAAFSSSAANVHEAFPAGTRFCQVTSTIFQKVQEPSLCVLPMSSRWVLCSESHVGLVHAHLTASPFLSLWSSGPCCMWFPQDSQVISPGCPHTDVLVYGLFPRSSSVKTLCVIICFFFAFCGSEMFNTASTYHVSVWRF